MNILIDKNGNEYINNLAYLKALCINEYINNMNATLKEKEKIKKEVLCCLKDNN